MEPKGLASTRPNAPAPSEIVEIGSKASRDFFVSGFLLDWLTGANAPRVDVSSVLEPEKI